MDFSKINCIGRSDFLPKRNLSDLIPGEIYNLTSIKRVKTIYGQKTVLILNQEFQIFLPTRFNTFFDKEPEQFTNLQSEVAHDKVIMKYLGNRLFEFYNKS